MFHQTVNYMDSIFFQVPKFRIISGNCKTYIAVILHFKVNTTYMDTTGSECIEGTLACVK